jgi:hypothetical protein
MKAIITFNSVSSLICLLFQNERVTLLKIDNNPFAKGFRENGLSYAKRKQNETGKCILIPLQSGSGHWSLTLHLSAPNIIANVCHV